MRRLRPRQLVDLYVRDLIDDSPRPIAFSSRSLDLATHATWLVPDPGEPQFVLGSWTRSELLMCSWLRALIVATAAVFRTAHRSGASRRCHRPGAKNPYRQLRGTSASLRVVEARPVLVDAN